MSLDEVKKKLAASRRPKQEKISGAALLRALTHKPHPNPLAKVEYKGDLEADARAEMDALGKGLSGASKQWQEQYAQMNDSEYWVALCFADRDAKERFLRYFQLIDLGDKYLDGHQVSRRLGHDIDD